MSENDKIESASIFRGEDPNPMPEDIQKKINFYSKVRESQDQQYAAALAGVLQGASQKKLSSSYKTEDQLKLEGYNLALQIVDLQASKYLGPTTTFRLWLAEHIKNTKQ